MRDARALRLGSGVVGRVEGEAVDAELLGTRRALFSLSLCAVLSCAHLCSAAWQPCSVWNASEEEPLEQLMLGLWTSTLSRRGQDDPPPFLALDTSAVSLLALTCLAEPLALLKVERRGTASRVVNANHLLLDTLLSFAPYPSLCDSCNGSGCTSVDHDGRATPLGVQKRGSTAHLFLLITTSFLLWRYKR